MKNVLITLKRIHTNKGYAWGATFVECGRYRELHFYGYTKRESINLLRRSYNVSVPHRFY